MKHKQQYIYLLNIFITLLLVIIFINCNLLPMNEEEYNREYENMNDDNDDNDDNDNNDDVDSLVLNQVTTTPILDARGSHSNIIFNNSIWMIGGIIDWDTESEVWYSSDGSNWILGVLDANFFNGIAEHASVYFNNKIWVLGGYYEGIGNHDYATNSIYSSTNGTNWIEEDNSNSFTDRCYHSTVIFNNKIWIIAGIDSDSSGEKYIYNDVWSSSDGINWFQETDNTGFSKRRNHSSVIFQNKIWVIGGYNGAYCEKDIWNSSDGVNWTLVSSDPGFCGREGHSSVVYKNKIWVIGGYDHTDKDIHDVWNSSNGIDWQLVGANNECFYNRGDFDAIVFNDKIWIIAGNEISGGWSLTNDVWYYEE